MKNQIKKGTLLCIFTFPVLLGCEIAKQKEQLPKYERWIGDIVQNVEVDAVGFTTCNGDDKVLQYFNVGEGAVYPGEKTSVVKKFKSAYQPIRTSNGNGRIRIRFLVNCKGESDRFRVLQTNEKYQETKLDERIVTQLLDITKGIENWEILKRYDVPVDYYMYLIFIMKDGKIIEILP